MSKGLEQSLNLFRHDFNARIDCVSGIKFLKHSLPQMNGQNPKTSFVATGIVIVTYFVAVIVFPIFSFLAAFCETSELSSI